MTAATPNPEDRPEQGGADWLAVRYVLGELSPPDATTFENRLADDQQAREAVARASQLVAAIGELSPFAAAPARRRGRRPLVALVSAAAAALLLGVFAWRNSDRPARVSAEDGDPARLVVLWSDASDAPIGEAVPEGADLADSEDALVPPDWLLAAVEQEAMSIDAEPSLDPASDEIETN